MTDIIPIRPNEKYIIHIRERRSYWELNKFRQELLDWMESDEPFLILAEDISIFNVRKFESNKGQDPEAEA